MKTVKSNKSKRTVINLTYFYVNNETPITNALIAKFRGIENAAAHLEPHMVELERENARLRAGYLDLLGQVEQAREGFGIYHNSKTMDSAVATARALLRPNAKSEPHGELAQGVRKHEL